MLNGVGIAFLVLFALSVLGDMVLTWLNLRRMGQVGICLPPVFQDHIDAQLYQKTLSYNRDSQRLGLVQTAVDSALLIVLIYLGGFEAIDQMARSAAPGGYYTTALIFATVIFAIKLAFSLPFDLYDTFVIEERYGFNRTTPRLFLMDLLKSLLLVLVLGLPLYMAILWFMDQAGQYWWLWAWCFWEAFQILLIVIYPVWIAPLFNKFTPLPEGTLRERIMELSRKARFPLEKIMVMDGSRRSTHSNAFFTGLGKKKRIVLFDTLLSQMDTPHLLGVIAHEMGHYKLGHIKKSLALGAILSLGALYLLHLLMGYEPFYHGLGFSRPSNYAALIIFSLCASTVSFLFKPLASALSRRQEYQADRFAAELTGDPRSMAEVIALLAKENLSNLDPHPWYSFFHYSHPAPVERVQAIVQKATPSPTPSPRQA